jgi:hypothetical protein
MTERQSKDPGNQPERRIAQSDRRTFARGGRRATDRHDDERVWRAHQIAKFLEQQQPPKS